MTRQDYLDTRGTDEERRAAHRAYYAQLVTPGMVDAVGRAFGSRLVEGSDPENLNHIPLSSWDRLGYLCHTGTQAKLRELGDYLTAAGIVCILKEAARQWVEKQAVASMT